MAPPILPESCGVAFKEWAGVCEALADGRQTLILRKGGIAEGPKGFVPEHPVFWLYPTHLHESEQGLRVAREGPEPDQADEDAVGLRALAVVAAIGYIDRPEALEALEDLHVWTAETVEKRFRYRKPGLWVLGVRVYRAPEPVRLAVTAAHAGCKTWVPLDPPVSTAGAAAVLDEAEFARRLDRLRAAAGLASER